MKLLEIAVDISVFLLFDYIDACGNIQKLITKLTVNHYSISNLNHKNINSFSQLLLLLGNISLNLGFLYQHTLLCSNKWIA